MTDSRPILFASSFSDPAPEGQNSTVPTQAAALRGMGRPVEILAWPREQVWRGPRPGRSAATLASAPYLHAVLRGIPYHIVTLPEIWAERVLTEDEWEEAVGWGMRALDELQPALVHLQFWQNLWWILEAAQRLGIPSVYSAHDYGLACQRTLLVTGHDTLCDGVANIEKCTDCVVAGRGALGRANEMVAAFPPMQPLLRRAFGRDGAGPLARRGGVRMPARMRTGLIIERVGRVLRGLSALIVTSDFGAGVYQGLGMARDRTHILPWFHSQSALLQQPAAFTGALRMAFVARISPEKGLHVLLTALEKLSTEVPVELHIAGAVGDDYGRRLKAKYAERAGAASVKWHGWVANDTMPDFYRDIDIAVIPTLAHETGPLSLIEAFAHGRPAICTDIATVRNVLHEGVNGLTFPFGDSSALAALIRRVAEGPALLASLAANTRNVWNAAAYAGRLSEVYDQVLAAPHRAAALTGTT